MTSLCVATDDTVRSAVLSLLSSAFKRALYFGQDAEATAHATVVIIPLYLWQDTLYSRPIGRGLTVPSHRFESLLVNVTGRLALQQEF
jgi:hypothetical protein